MNTFSSPVATFLTRSKTPYSAICSAADSAVNSADQALLPIAVAAVHAAGNRIKERFSPDARPRDLQDIGSMIHTNDGVSMSLLRQALAHLAPGIQWAEDEAGGGVLPPGQWWVTDPVEGAINHVHGMTDWCVTITLVRDNVPVMTVVYLPMMEHTYTALRGGGATLNGAPLQVSAKPALNAALVGTGQAMPGESLATYQRIGQSVTTMLQAALVVKVSVPATLQLIHVAAGSLDVFWQYSNVRSGLLAGALLVAEAGGTVTDINGKAWSLHSKNFLASAPALHQAAVIVLSSIA